MTKSLCTGNYFCRQRADNLAPQDRHTTMDDSLWANSRLDTRSKARLGNAKEMAMAWRNFVVCTAACSSRPRFHSCWPWWPNLNEYSLGMVYGQALSAVAEERGSLPTHWPRAVGQLTQSSGSVAFRGEEGVVRKGGGVGAGGWHTGGKSTIKKKKFGASRDF